MKMPTLKKFMLRHYEQIPGSTDFEYHKLILITAVGMICGTPVSEDEECEEIGLLIKKNHQLVQDYRTTYDIPKQKRLTGNDGYIMLKDVTIMTNNQNTRLSSLVVFCDEIIGVTVGIME